MSHLGDHYAILGIADQADDREIRKAYVNLLKQHFRAGSTSFEALPPERIKLIQEAYSCLRDPQCRTQYDATRARRDHDHRTKFRRRQHRLRAYDRRHGLTVIPQAASSYAKWAAALTALACAGLVIVTWLSR